MDNTTLLKPRNTVVGRITEYELNWRSIEVGSTHELVMTRECIFVTGQNMGKVAKFSYEGRLLSLLDLPKGSGPHGVLVDQQQRLWVSLEFAGKVVRIDDQGGIAQEVDVRIHPPGSQAINPAPHGICLGADKETIWFTGKRTSTIGRINPDRTVQHFQLSSLGGVPIYLQEGTCGHVWGTALNAGVIFCVARDGTVREFQIPTHNSRPIAIISDPVGMYMWFTEETGRKIGRIDMNGKIDEYSVPILQSNHILASLAFDPEMNLWVQVYIGSNEPIPEGADYIIKFDKSIRDVIGTQLKAVAYDVLTVPSRQSILHRIRLGSDGNLWFTEMKTDRLGKVEL